MKYRVPFSLIPPGQMKNKESFVKLFQKFVGVGDAHKYNYYTFVIIAKFHIDYTFTYYIKVVGKHNQ